MPTAESSTEYLKKVARSASSHAGVVPESAVRPDVSAAPEISDQPGQFGPLPLVLRQSAPDDKKTGGNRHGRGNGRARAIILCWLIGVFLAAGVAWALTAALAQQKPPDPKAAAPARGAPAPKQQQQQSQQQQQPPPPALPVSTEQTLYLIRSTLLTLNDANRSGNYTVLRDLAAPDFQARNTAADLSQSFSDLRRRNFDLYGAALLSPQLTALPALDQRGFLHLSGYFPTRPQQINFDLLFANVANQWRLFGIAINTPDAPSAAR